MRKIACACICLCLLQLMSCSTKTPESVLDKELSRKIQAESNGAIKLRSIKKTDGIEGEKDGVKTYHLNFIATIQYLTDCYKGDGSAWPYHDFSVRDAPNGFGKEFHMHADTKVDITGSADFEKHENGWVFLENSLELTHAEKNIIQ